MAEKDQARADLAKKERELKEAKADGDRREKEAIQDGERKLQEATDKFTKQYFCTHTHPYYIISQTFFSFSQIV